MFSFDWNSHFLDGYAFLYALLACIVAGIIIGAALANRSRGKAKTPFPREPQFCHRCGFLTSDIVKVHTCSDPRSQPTTFCQPCWTILK